MFKMRGIVVGISFSVSALSLLLAVVAFFMVASAKAEMAEMEARYIETNKMHMSNILVVQEQFNQAEDVIKTLADASVSTMDNMKVLLWRVDTLDEEVTKVKKHLNLKP